MITLKELDILRHALGLNRGATISRNSYVAKIGSQHSNICLAMVDKGLMEEGNLSGLHMLQVSQAGMLAAEPGATRGEVDKLRALTT